MLSFINERISLILSWRRDWPYEAQQPAVRLHYSAYCEGANLLQGKWSLNDKSERRDVTTQAPFPHIKERFFLWIKNPLLNHSKFLCQGNEFRQ